MKHLILATAIALAALQTTTANARSILRPTPTADRYEITKMEIDAKSMLLEHDVTGGTLLIDYDTNTVRLQFDRPFHCTPGRVCPAVMPTPVIIELPIVSTSYGFCGGVLLLAEENLMPVDGMRKTAEIYVEGYNHCTKTHSKKISFNLEEEAYLRMDAQHIEALSRFEGEHLNIRILPAIVPTFRAQK